MIRYLSSISIAHAGTVGRHLSNLTTDIYWPRLKSWKDRVSKFSFCEVLGRMAILPSWQNGHSAKYLAKAWHVAERPCQHFAKFAESPPCNLTVNIINIYYFGNDIVSLRGCKQQPSTNRYPVSGVLRGYLLSSPRRCCN
eukprot:2033341-Pleurochrysis_carterae.AAC.7